MAQAGANLFVSGKVFLSTYGAVVVDSPLEAPGHRRLYKVNGNTVCGSIQDMPCHNILSALCTNHGHLCAE